LPEILYRYSNSFTASGEAFGVTGFLATPADGFGFTVWFTSAFGFCGSAAQAQSEKEAIKTINLKLSRLKFIVTVSLNHSLKKVLPR
jgi:hypothetical protein